MNVISTNESFAKCSFAINGAATNGNRRSHTASRNSHAETKGKDNIISPATKSKSCQRHNTDAARYWVRFEKLAPCLALHASPTICTWKDQNTIPTAAKAARIGRHANIIYCSYLRLAL